MKVYLWDKWGLNQFDLAGIIGKTPTNIIATEDEITFDFSDCTACKFFHEQSCCEAVSIEDVNGDWGDLIGTPLLVAEERISDCVETEDGWGTETWTFYTFRSLKGSVDVRWHGESNGYYSERVDFRTARIKHLDYP